MEDGPGDVSDIVAQQRKLRLSATSYIDRHPELSCLLNDFVGSVLEEKPRDVFAWAHTYFAGLKEHPVRLVEGKRPMVVAGPSGAGKGTIIKRLMEIFPDQLGFSVSHTTRKPRPGEADGVHYHFTTPEAFGEFIRKQEFVEHAEVHSNLYGTSIEAVAAVAQAGRVCLLDIDIQGVRNIKCTNLCPYYVFIAPPSMEKLEERLRNRKTEEEEQVQRRLVNAREEMAYGMAEGVFDHVVVNDDLDKAVEELKRVMLAWYPDLVVAA